MVRSRALRILRVCTHRLTNSVLAVGGGILAAGA